MADAPVPQPVPARAGIVLASGSPRRRELLAQLGLQLTIVSPDVDESPLAGEAPVPARELEATLCWMHERPLQPGARLLLKHGTRTTRAIVGEIRERLELETLGPVPAPDGLALNDLGHVTLRVADPLVVDPYGECRETGAFVLIDDQDHATLAAGMIVSAR